ncbi:MAG: YajQ family cyclic di-GMP-binding protein [Bacteroidia bacterium]|nr:YajQ family cyclic di-GMP-binding protein [Bacteroidia bacterium]MCF8446807.1 YajQ family cyclic di-GMP-binding protein [Bacteroidia bacterium]
MPSFDIVNKIDLQSIDNAINTAKKELLNRYDLKDELCSIEFDKKSKSIKLEAKQDMALQTLIDIILGKFSKQQLDVRTIDLSTEPRPSGKLMLQDLKIKEGIDKEKAKKILSHIKAYNAKVQASINDDQIRVTSKKIDDLQELISELRQHDFEVPLQFENFRS